MQENIMGLKARRTESNINALKPSIETGKKIAENYRRLLEEFWQKFDEMNGANF